MSDEWSQPEAPPPPLFAGKKERDLVKQVNDELIERVIGQQVLYYPIDLNASSFHPLYGEAIEKTQTQHIAALELTSSAILKFSSTSADWSRTKIYIFVRVISFSMMVSFMRLQT